MITMNLTPIGLNWTILFRCLEMTFVVIWRYINKTELNLIKTADIQPKLNTETCQHTEFAL